MSESETETKPRRSTLRTLITLGFYALVVAFFAYYLRGLEWSALADLDIGWHWCALAVVVGIVQRFGLPAVWVLIVKDMGATVRNYAEYNLVYAKAWLGRYLPGKVAMVAARIYFAEKLGVRRSVIAVSTLMELGVQLLTVGVIGLAGIATLSSAFDVIADYAVLMYIFIGVLAFCLLPPVFNQLLRIAFRVFDRKQQTPVPVVGMRTVAKAVVAYIFIIAVTGVQTNLVAASLDPGLLEHYVFLWGTYSIGGVLGMVAVFAPSGLGVREAVQLPLLALVTTKEVAVALVVMIRLVETLVDVGFYLASWFLARRLRSAGSD